MEGARNKPLVMTGPLIGRVFFGFQVFENIPPRLPRSFSPCKSKKNAIKLKYLVILILRNKKDVKKKRKKEASLLY